MSLLFNTPQRQSKIGIVVLFFHALQQYARAIWPFLLLMIINFSKVNKLFVFGGVALVLLLLVAIAYLQYVNFTFYIEDESNEFIISEGVFNKTRTVIQLQKIQQVNINQNLIQRVINVFALDVDTAGSNKKEGKIRAVSHSLALALKERLLDNAQDSNSEVSSENETTTDLKEEAPFIRISISSLIKYGLTSNYFRTLGLLLATFVTLFENIRNVTSYSDIDKRTFETFVEKQLALTSFLIFAVFILVVVLIINLIRTIVKYYNFQIARQQGSLLLSYGLINSKSTILKPEKIQITSVSQNYFQKKMDILPIKIKQATGGEREEKQTAIEIPGCSEAEKNAIFQLLFHAIPKKGAMLRPNFRKLGFSIFTTVIIPALIFYILATTIIRSLQEYFYLLPVYIIIITLLLYFGFQNYRLFIDKRFIIRQSGVWDIENQIIEIKKIQAISTSQLFWHKSLNIGSLTLHTAGGDLSFSLGNYDRIKEYVNLWLYEIETTNSNWM